MAPLQGFQEILQPFVIPLLWATGGAVIGTSLLYLVAVYRNHKRTDRLHRTGDYQDKWSPQQIETKSQKRFSPPHVDTRSLSTYFRRCVEEKNYSKELRIAYRQSSVFDQDLQLLNSRFWWRRAQAAQRSRLYPTEENRKLLLNLLDDPRIEVRLASLETLSTLPKPGLGGELIRIFESNSPSVDWILVLELMSAKIPMDEVATLVNSESERLQKAGAILLGREGNLQAVPLLEELSKSNNKKIRSEAVRSLGRLQAPEALEPLFITASDQDPLIQAQTARSLGQTGSLDALDKLDELCTCDNFEVRLEAFLALSKFDEPGRKIINRYRSRYPDLVREANLKSYQAVNEEVVYGRL